MLNEQSEKFLTYIVKIEKCQGHPTTDFSQMLENAVLGYLEWF